MAKLGGTFDSGDVPTHAIDELRSINSWVCWKYVQREGQSKPTKPPMNPHNGRGASHSNPLHWGTHKQAKMGTRRYGFAGEGFVLSEKDNFTGIDLDNCRDPETGEFEPWAEAVVALAETYAEISPSGKGVRLFARGKVASATKCDPAGVEIYGKERYLTVTENHIEGTPLDIRPAPQTLEMLLSRVEAMQPPREEPGPTAAPHINTTPRQAASQGGGGEFFRNVNDKALQLLGMWVPELCPGAKYQASSGAYRVSSKSLGRSLQEDLSFHPEGIKDHGVADMGDANQGRRSPIDSVMEHGGAPDAMAAAKWLCERMNKTPESLGWRDGAQHDEELAKIGDEIADELIARSAAPVEATDDTPKRIEDDELIFPYELTYHGGLLGEIIEWVYGTSQNPSRIVALATAISVIGAATGRAFCGPSESGMHLYIALLGKSGAGKNHAHDAAKRILREAGLGQLSAPGKFTSQNALEAHLKDNAISVCMMDEIGETIAKFNSPRASDHLKGMADTLMTLWGVNRGSYTTTRYAQSAGTEIIYPSLSVLGLSTHEEFWQAFQGADVKSGFLNRFLVMAMPNVRTKKITPMLGSVHTTPIPQGIIDGLRRLRGLGCDEPTWSTYLAGSATTFETECMTWGVGAKQLWSDHDDWICNQSDAHPDREPFYARTAEMALRLAAIRAIGDRRSHVTIEDMQWGRSVADFSALSMMRGARLYMAGSEFEARRNHVLRLVMESKGGCDRQHLAARVKVKPRDLDDAIGSLIAGGVIVLVEVASRKDGKGGPKKKLYKPGPNAD